MTKRGRFLKVLANQPVDHVPTAFFHHFTPDEKFGRGLVSKEAFEHNIEGHRLAREDFNPDVVKIMNDSLIFMPVDASFVEKASDLRKIEPLPMNSEFVQKTLELTKRVREIYEDNDTPPIFATSFSPTFVLRNALSVGGLAGLGGDETRFLQFVEEDPEAVAVACEALSQGISDLNKLLITEGGVDGVYFCVNNRGGFFKEDIFRKYISPSEKAVLDNTNKVSDTNLLHICGFAGLANNLELFKDFEAAAYNWAVYAEHVTLSEGKKFFGGKAVFGGFEQNTVIYNGSREEVEKATFQILDDCGQIGTMLGADCVVPLDIDNKRLNWVRDAAVKYAETH